MRNWIGSAVVALASTLVAAPASALDGTTNNSAGGGIAVQFGESCTLLRVDDIDLYDASVMLYGAGRYTYPDGKYYQYVSAPAIVHAR